MAADRNRPDLVKRLDAANRQLSRPAVTVAVVGEFKQGKSTLVNALLQTAVCAVDADIVTVVPTLIRYGEAASATAQFDGGAVDAPPQTRKVDIEMIDQLVSESGNPANAQRLRSVEITLPHRLLRSGLRLIDTPGVGGLDSAHGMVTLGVLDQVGGIVFITDASAELNQPELDFLKQALERCPRAVCVLTKTDLYPQWRRIADLDTAHLRRAGIDIDVIPVSSFLRLRSRQRPELTEESGFGELVRYLATQVVAPAHDDVGAAVAEDVRFATQQLEQELSAERTILAEPEAVARVVRDLETARNRAAHLASPNATWQQVLGDGIQDLVADVQHDLQERLRTVSREAEALVDATDPKDSWTEIEEWLRRQAVAASIGNYDLLKQRAAELVEDVSAAFDLEAGQSGLSLNLTTPTGLDALRLAPASTLSAPGGRFASTLAATRLAVVVPMALFGIASSLLGAAVIVPVSLVLAGGLGQKLLRDERKRQVAHRQGQAKAAARRFLDEVSFIMTKEAQDALRRTQRRLRDDFQERALVAQRSSANALDAAAKAGQLGAAERAEKAAHLGAQVATLQGISGRLAPAAQGAR
jgi:Dynamin family